MSFLATVFKPQFRATDLKNISNSFVGYPVFGAGNTLATSKSALTLSAFYNAINILSDDIAKLPKPIFKVEGKSRLKDKDHYLNHFLNTRPNLKMTAFDFWKCIEALTLVKGNAFVQCVKDGKTGRVTALHIRENNDVKVFENDDALFYQYKGKLYSSHDFLHFKGFSFDGKIGVGVVTYAAKSLGVALENQEYGQTIYKNRGMSYGVVETDKAVDPGNKKVIEDAIGNKFVNPAPHKIALLDEGFKYKSIAISPQEAQFLETNKNGIIEVCRWLNIAPHKLKDLSNANYSNIYQQDIKHVQETVLPRVIAREQEINYKLFTASEQTTTYTKFNVASLLRGDLDAKSKYYTAGIYAGYYTRNEVRELEELNPIEGLDEPLQPVNMQALSMANEIIKQQSNGSK